MSSRDKLLARLRSKDTGWTFDDLRKAAEQVGITVTPGSGSHWKFSAPGRYPVTVPRRDEIKSFYVRKIRDLVDDLLADSETEE